MHDLRVLREQLDLLRDGMRRRGSSTRSGRSSTAAEALDRERRTLIQRPRSARPRATPTRQEVARRKRAGGSADELIAQARALGDEIARLERELTRARTSCERLLLELPNVTLPRCRRAAKSATRRARVGHAAPARGVQPHWEIGEQLGILDLARGAEDHRLGLRRATAATARGSCAR